MPRYRVSSCLRPLQGGHFQGQKSGWRGYLQTCMYSSAGYSPRPCVVVVVPAQSRPVPVGGRGRGFGPGNWTPPPTPTPLLSSRPALQSLARVRPCLHTYIHTILQPRPSKFCPPHPPPPPLQPQVFFFDFVKRNFGGWKHYDMGAVHT